MTPAWPHGDPRDVARAVVSDPRFTVEPPVAATKRWWLDDVRDATVHFVRGIFHALDHALGSGNPLDTAIGFIVIGAAFVLVGYCVFVIVRSSGRSLARRAGRGADADVAPAAQSAGALRAAAVAAARAGRYRDAAALLFLSAARALDERGRLAYDPARTPGEYRRLVRDPVFDALASDVVVAVFAAAEPQRDLFERMQAAYDRFFAAGPR